MTFTLAPTLSLHASRPSARAGHLLGGHARGARRQDHVLAVLAPAPRRAVRVRRRAGIQQDRTVPPSRLPGRYVLPQPVFPREDFRHSAVAAFLLLHALSVPSAFLLSRFCLLLSSLF